MKLFCFFLTLSFLIVADSYGETLYVTDVFAVMVRTGPDSSNKILAMPKSGTAVEIIDNQNGEKLDEWVQVRIAGGKEGWMLSQYLVPGPPKHEVIAQLEKENSVLKKKTETLSEENSRIKTELKDKETFLASQIKSGDGLREAYETLKNESKDFLALKASHEEASRELDVNKKQLEELKKEVEGLRSSQTLRWFIAGASIILVGFVIGFVSRRPRKRPSLL